MSTPGEQFSLTLAKSAGMVDVTGNIAATGRLLDVLRTEESHPQSVIGARVEFADDGSFDSSIGQPLAEVSDPADPWSSYLAGLRRSDCAGQIVLLQREKSAILGRVVVMLREGQPTRLLGQRTLRLQQFGITEVKRLTGQLAPPALLDLMGVRLVEAFDARRVTGGSETQSRWRRTARIFQERTGQTRLEVPGFRELE